MIDIKKLLLGVLFILNANSVVCGLVPVDNDNDQDGVELAEEESFEEAEIIEPKKEVLVTMNQQTVPLLAAAPQSESIPPAKSPSRWKERVLWGGLVVSSALLGWFAKSASAFDSSELSVEDVEKQLRFSLSVVPGRVILMHNDPTISQNLRFLIQKDFEDPNELMNKVFGIADPFVAEKHVVGFFQAEKNEIGSIDVLHPCKIKHINKIYSKFKKDGNSGQEKIFVLQGLDAMLLANYISEAKAKYTENDFEVVANASSQFNCGECARNRESDPVFRYGLDRTQGPRIVLPALISTIYREALINNGYLPHMLTDMFPNEETEQLVYKDGYLEIWRIRKNKKLHKEVINHLINKAPNLRMLCQRVICEPFGQTGSEANNPRVEYIQVFTAAPSYQSVDYAFSNTDWNESKSLVPFIKQQAFKTENESNATRVYYREVQKLNNSGLIQSRPEEVTLELNMCKALMIPQYEALGQVAEIVSKYKNTTVNLIVSLFGGKSFGIPDAVIDEGIKKLLVAVKGSNVRVFLCGFNEEEAQRLHTLVNNNKQDVLTDPNLPVPTIIVADKDRNPLRDGIDQFIKALATGSIAT